MVMMQFDMMMRYDGVIMSDEGTTAAVGVGLVNIVWYKGCKQIEMRKKNNHHLHLHLHLHHVHYHHHHHAYLGT